LKERAAGLSEGTAGEKPSRGAREEIGPENSIGQFKRGKEVEDENREAVFEENEKIVDLVSNCRKDATGGVMTTMAAGKGVRILEVPRNRRSESRISPELGGED